MATKSQASAAESTMAPSENPRIAVAPRSEAATVPAFLPRRLPFVRLARSPSQATTLSARGRRSGHTTQVPFTATSVSLSPL